MSNITAGVLIKLKDQFSSGIDKASNKVNSFQSKMQGAFSKIDGILNSTASNLATLGVSIGVGATINKMIAFEDRINKIGTIARRNAKDVETAEKQLNGLSEAIYKAAMQPDIKVDANEIIDAMDIIMTKTGNMDFAKENIENIGRAMRAFGASGSDIGSMMSEFSKLNYSAEETAKLMDELYYQGNQGAFTASEFAKFGPAIIAAYSSIGTASEDLKNANAVMQVLTAGTGDASASVTVLESIMSDLTNPEIQEKLQNLGNIIGADFSVRDSEGNFKDLHEIIMKIVNAKDKMGGNFDMLSDVFGSDLSREAIKHFDNYDEILEKVLDVSNAQGQVNASAMENAQSLAANIQNLQTAFDSFANKNVAPYLEKVTGILNDFAKNPERFDAVFKVIAAGFGIFMTAKLVSGVANTISSINSLKNMAKGNISSTLQADSRHIQGTGTPIPVFVTNMGQFFSNGNNSNTFNVGQSSSNIPNINNGKMTWKSLGKTAGAMGAAVTAIPMAISGFMAANDPSLSKKEQNKMKGEAVGGAVGSIAGTAIGTSAGAATSAAIGSVVPGLGTAIGALVGAGVGIAGGYLGSKLGGKIGESLTKEDTLEKTITANNIQNNNAQVEMKGAANIGVDIKLTDERTYYKATPYNNNIPNINIQTGNIEEIRNYSS
ncbi:phage tail tape measure protein [Brachyspira alvinipulli]|uniref:phage tail tape measure protein n=1 Tax=Brachyspira alvinipulli TaxID=84379 RepID=UPI0004816D3C|nr:phage tail tape measure protein [Brachyspira alvinipulli]